MAGTSARSPSIAPPAAANTPQDHGGWVVIANALGLVLALSAIGVRVFIRKCISPPAKKDDAAACVATAVGILQASLVFWQVHQGFAKTIHQLPQENVEKIHKIGYSANPLFLVTIYLSKGSILFLLRRITPDGNQRKIIQLCFVACGLFAVISILLSLLRCNLSRPWLQSCSGLLAQWQAIAAFDIATELMLLILPVGFIIRLRMMNAKKKLKVISAFSTRVGVIVCAVFHLHQLQQNFKSSDPTLTAAYAAIWKQAEMHYALIATTLPCLTPFLSTMNTNFGALELETVTGAATSPRGQKVRKDSPQTTTLTEDSEDKPQVELVHRTPALLNRIMRAAAKVDSANPLTDSQR